MFVGIGGNIGQYQKIREICDLQNIPLILDFSFKELKYGELIHNSLINQVGWDVDVSVFSFQVVKNLPTQIVV